MSDGGEMFCLAVAVFAVGGDGMCEAMSRGVCCLIRACEAMEQVFALYGGGFRGVKPEAVLSDVESALGD